MIETSRLSMSVRRLAENQPESFAFTPENEAWCEEIIKKYPEGRRGVRGDLAACGWRKSKMIIGCRSQRSRKSRKSLACLLSGCSKSPPSTRCSISRRSANSMSRCAARRLACWPDPTRSRKFCNGAIGEQGQVTADGMFSWIEVECLGACCNAPMVQINEDYYEDLTPENFETLLDDLAAGRPVKIGSQNWAASLRSLRAGLRH